MCIKSSEEYREDARLVRALAEKATEEGARGPLLGMADLLDYLVRRAESHPIEQWQTPLSQSPSTPPP